MPGAVPLVVKPSVWHSLLLKLNSRSDDDFKAFLSFLNLRFSENNRNSDSRRPKILVEVLERSYEPDLADMGIPKLLLSHFTDFYFENGNHAKLEERFLREMLYKHGKI